MFCRQCEHLWDSETQTSEEFYMSHMGHNIHDAENQIVEALQNIDIDLYNLYNRVRTHPKAEQLCTDLTELLNGIDVAIARARKL